MLMNSLRLLMQLPTLPRRSKLAQSVAITQSNFCPRRGFANRSLPLRNASLSGTGSSFQQTTRLPWSRSASARPSCEPMQSPSGRMWPTMQKVRWARMPAMIRSIIFGCAFIFRGGVLDFVNDLEHAVALFNRLIHQEAQLRSVFEDDGLADEALDAFAVVIQFGEGLFLLLLVAENANVNRGGVEIGADADVVDVDEAGGADGDFAADDFTQFAFQQFAHPLEPERRHTNLSAKIKVSE